MGGCTHGGRALRRRACVCGPGTGIRRACGQRYAADYPLGDVWYAVVKQLDEAQTIVALVRQLAMQAQLVAREGGVWTLRVQRSSLNQTTTRERLLKALSQVTDCTSLHVESGLATDTPALRDKAHAEARQKQAEAIVHSDPKVQHLVQSLGASIVPGSIRPV